MLSLSLSLSLCLARCPSLSRARARHVAGNARAGLGRLNPRSAGRRRRAPSWARRIPRQGVAPARGGARYREIPRDTARYRGAPEEGPGARGSRWGWRARAARGRACGAQSRRGAAERGGAVKEAAVKEAAVKEAAVKEAAVKEGGPRALRQRERARAAQLGARAFASDLGPPNSAPVGSEGSGRHLAGISDIWLASPTSGWRLRYLAGRVSPISPRSAEICRDLCLVAR